MPLCIKVRLTTPKAVTGNGGDLLIKSIEGPRRWVARLSGLPTSLGIGVLGFAVALPFATLDFDAVHDGVMVAAAIVVRDGGLPHLDAFAQYGPVSPVLQGTFLRVFDDPVLGIRVVNALLVGAIAFAIADSGRVTPSYWPISSSAGRWAALAWLVLADFFLWVPQLPWSSTMAAGLLCSLVVLAARGLHFAERRKAIPTCTYVVLFGIFLALLPFTRINVGVAALLVALVVFALTKWFVRDSLAVAGVMLVWLMASTALVVGMAVSGILEPWWQQAIVWPLQWRDSMESAFSFDLERALRGSLIFLPIVSVISLLVWQAQTCPNQFRSPQNAIGWLAGGSGALLVLLLYANPLASGFYQAAQVGLRPPWLDSLVSGSLNLLTLLVFVFLFVALVIFVRALLDLFRGQAESQTSLVWLLLLGFSSAGLVQIYPVPDSRHIWWGLPIAILVITGSLGRAKLWSPLVNPFAGVLYVAAGVALISGFSYLNLQRLPAPSDSVASGMLLQPRDYARVSQITMTLTDALKAQKAVFLTAEGAWSVFDGSFHSTDPYFVGWGNPINTRARLESSNFVVLDSDSAKDFLQSETGRHWRVNEGGGGLVVLER